jgi:hypothetical protein
MRNYLATHQDGRNCLEKEEQSPSFRHYGIAVGSVKAVVQVNEAGLLPYASSRGTLSE